MAELTSRQRVRLAINHEEPDKVPIDFGAMRSTGINAMAYNNLKKHLGIGEGQTKVYDVFQQLAEPEESVMKIMGADVIQLHRYKPAFDLDISRWRPGKLMDGSDCIYPASFAPVENENGDLDIIQNGTVIARMPKGGYYFDQIHHPYAKANSMDDIDKIELGEITQEELEYLRETAKKLYNETDYAILASFGGNILEAGQLDWGYERFFMEMALNPDLIHYYLNRLTDAYIRDLEKFMDAVGDYIDVIQFGDDLGTQENTQISLSMYKELIKPYHSRQYQYIRNNYPNVKVFLHSCGAIYDLIPDLIDAGVEILNPVQLSAKKMDPTNLKKEFGKHISFWGGGINTQTTLTFGSLDKIRQEVKELMEIFSPGGGFVFTQVHNIQADISPEKVMAVYNTANELRNSMYR